MNPNDPNGMYDRHDRYDEHNGRVGDDSEPVSTPRVSQAEASITDDFVNAVLARISVSGQQNWSGNTPFPWSVTMRYTVAEIRTTIGAGEARVTAKVHVESKLASYTEDVTAGLVVHIQGAQVCVRITSIVVPIYVKPGGQKIDLGQIDIYPYLDRQIEACFKVLPEPYTAPLPQEVGGAQVTVTTSNPQITLQAGVIQASVVLGVS
jgi:hypothetical protein